MISNCGKDERGSYSGGQAGDQNGKEYWLINWFDRPWNCVLRHPDSKVRAEIAKLARAAAQNNNIGYDQSERMTFWNQLQASGYDPAAIRVPCEADCSSSTMAIVKAVGYRLGNGRLQSVNASLATNSMRGALRNVGFDVLTDNMYIKSDACLLAGDILLNDSAHAAINVTDGAHADKSYGTPHTTPQNQSTGPETTGSNQTGTTTLPTTTSLKNGDLVAIKENAVWWTGYTIPSWVKELNWYVMSVNGVRVVLGRSEDGHYNVMSPINAGYLTLVKPKSDSSSAATNTDSTNDESPDTYTVQSGDSLWSIAVKHLGSGGRWTEIAKINGIKGTTIYPGQTLKLPRKE